MAWQQDERLAVIMAGTEECLLSQGEVAPRATCKLCGRAASDHDTDERMAERLAQLKEIECPVE